MKLRYEKNIRVLNDVMGYCHLIGANKFNIDFEMFAASSVIVVKAQIPALDPQHLHQLDKLLNIPRQHEVEQYYWNISGEEDIDNELSLAGMMVDKAEIDYTDEMLTIRMYRCDPSPGE